MATYRRCLTSLGRALARAGYDADFRVQVLDDAHAAQQAYGLDEAAWHVLVAAVARLEHDRDAAGNASDLADPPPAGDAPMATAHP